ncbi:nuclease-related domain-containing protein [Sporosarcina sp. 179-K 3D1 HS]|uniref:nuclease-related domain-containing protein n=1 Tax=Sporosarcina sp. 179-K 3D1 HS TaxID=3232169 RepID=UPI0039A13219
MIVKNKSIPYSLFGMKAMQQRISTTHPFSEKLKERIRIAQAGANGEKLVDQIFLKYQFGFEHYIFHDLNLSSSGKFQLDTLFLSSQGAYILEIKNIAGRIHFPEEWNQMVRVLENGQMDAFECPSVQLERNHFLLEDWFHSRNLSVPVAGAVVFTQSRQLIENSRPHLTMLFPYELPNVLRKREGRSPILDSKTLSKIVIELSNGHFDYNPFPLCTTMNINPHDIKSGVQCEKCGTLGMNKISRGWVCTSCCQVSRRAHRRAIHDWFMIVSETMTNRECREFLHVPANYTATRLLGELPLEHLGMSRGRFYRFPLEKMKVECENSPNLQGNSR